MSTVSVVFDACVLYPAPLRDFLLELASADLFRARWTDWIHDEWTKNLLEKRPDLLPGRIERTRSLMNRAVPDCLVTGYEPLVPSIELPDENDRHVVAAAVHAAADAIVTFNLKDFPPESLAKYNLEAIHPDDFIKLQLDFNGTAVFAAARTCRQRLRNPPVSPERYIETLRMQSLPGTAAALASGSSSI